MAKKTFRLLDEAVNREAPFLGDLQPGDEFEHDFYDPDSGLNAEAAVIAAGWVELVEENQVKAKGGSK